jgi:hypothetical protein
MTPPLLTCLPVKSKQYRIFIFLALDQVVQDPGGYYAEGNAVTAETQCKIGIGPLRDGADVG